MLRASGFVVRAAVLVHSQVHVEYSSTACSQDV